MTASEFLALPATGSFRRKRTSAYLNSLDFFRVRRRTALGLQESVAIKISVFAVTDGLRPFAAGHDRQLTGYPIHCPSKAVRGGLQRASCGHLTMTASGLHINGLHRGNMRTASSRRLFLAWTTRWAALLKSFNVSDDSIERHERH
jgi:hypothetical protein